MQEKPRPLKHWKTATLYWHAFRIVWDANPALVSFTLLLTLLTAITSPVQVWISKLMIDQIGLLIGQREVSSWQSLLVPLALYIGVWVVSQVSQTVFRSVQELLNISAINHAQYRIISKTAAGLGDCKGKTLASDHLDDKAYQACPSRPQRMADEVARQGARAAVGRGA